jgi:hypothetical protein
MVGVVDTEVGVRECVLTFSWRGFCFYFFTWRGKVGDFLLRDVASPMASIGQTGVFKIPALIGGNQGYTKPLPPFVSSQSSACFTGMETQIIFGDKVFPAQKLNILQVYI